MQNHIVTAALIIIGNEILSGRTQDANLQHLAKELNGVGVRLREVRVIADIEEEIIATVNALRVKYHYVFTTGGIGPTHDDITAASIAKAFDRKFIQHPEALRRMQKYYAEISLELNEARLRMTYTPEDAVLIDNPISAAPGFRIENVYVLAGVPKIMRAMLDGITGELVGGARMLSRSVLCNLGEGTIASGLGEIQNRYPEVDIGSYPQFGGGRFRTTLVLRHTDAALLEAAVEEVKTLIRAQGGEPRTDIEESP